MLFGSVFGGLFVFLSVVFVLLLILALLVAGLVARGGGKRGRVILAFAGVMSLYLIFLVLCRFVFLDVLVRWLG